MCNTYVLPRSLGARVTAVVRYACLTTSATRAYAGWLGTAILLACSPGWAETPSPGATFVAADGRDAWSGHLPSPSRAGTDGPLATIAAAQAAVRAADGVRLIYVREGTYAISAPLRIGEADAGERIMAYPGEHPVLYGGSAVPKWQPTDRGLVAAAATPLQKGAGLPQLLAGAAMLPNARFPRLVGSEDREAAWLFADSSPADIDPHHAFRVRTSDIDAFTAARPGAYVTIFGQRGWQDYVLPIKRADSATRIVTLDGTTWDPIGEGSRFAILNAAVTPGTWRLDPASSTLQLITQDAAPPAAAIIAASLPCIVSIEGGRDVTLAGLTLAGSATEGAAICLSHTQGVILDGLSITETGDGIRLDHATATRITNSEISRTAGTGISLRHSSDATVIEGNWLHDIGWLHQDASAIWFDASSHNRFARNRIEDVAKFGIGGGSLSDGGAYDNVIEGNEVDRTNLRTSDGGGIMLIGWAQDATHDVIRDNFIIGTTAFGNIGWDGKPHTVFQDPITRLVSEAIYLDDWASDVQVTGNLLCGNIGGMELHAGWDNLVSDNVLIDNSGIAFAVDAENWLGKGDHPHPMEHNVITRNTVILERPSTGQSGVSSGRGADAAARFDNNIYTGPGLNAYSFHHAPDHIWSDYSFGIDVWRRRGQDLESTIGVSAARVALRDNAVQVTGPADAPEPIRLDKIGRPQDRAGLAARVRQSCQLPE